MRNSDHPDNQIAMARGRGCSSLFLSCNALDGTTSFKAPVFNNSVITIRINLAYMARANV